MVISVLKFQSLEETKQNPRTQLCSLIFLVATTGRDNFKWAYFRGGMSEPLVSLEREK